MKNLVLSMTMLGMTFCFWGWLYNSPAWVSSVNATLSQLQASREASQRTSPYIVVVENKWAHHLYQLWNPNNQFTLLTPWDIKRGYERKKKKFTCQQDIYWLGEEKPSKQLLKWGRWKPVEDNHISAGASLLLYQIMGRP